MRLGLLLLGVALLAMGQEPIAAAERLVAARKFHEALRLLEESPARNARWHLTASQAYDGLNDPAQAVAEVEKALALEPQNQAAHLQLGQIFLSHNTPTAAYDVFTDGLRLFPGSFLMRLGRGLALKELQRYEEAAEELSLCLRAQPASRITFDALATVYLHAGRFDDLSALAHEQMETHPTDYRGYYYLAAAREGLSLPDDETLRLLSESITRNPNFAASLALSGKLLLRGERTAEAVKALERAVALRPDHVPSHMALANGYRKLGRDSDAGREFAIIRKLLKEQREQPSLRYHRGREGTSTTVKPPDVER